MNKKTIVILIPLLVLIIAAIGVLTFLLLSDDSLSPEKVYFEKIETAQKYLDSGDFDQAILYYRAAINEDDSKPEPYIALAKIYSENLNNVNEAINVLIDGYNHTGSPEIDEMRKILIEKYSLEDQVPEEKLNESDRDILNKALFDELATFTYKTYSDTLTVTGFSSLSGRYEVSYNRYNATFIYDNAATEQNVLNPETGLPYDNVRPTSIVFTDIRDILPTIESGVSIDDIRSTVATNVEKRNKDAYIDNDYIRFEFCGCLIRLAIDDSDRIIYPGCKNMIIPPENNIQANTVKLSGRIMDVTSGSLVNNAVIEFYSSSSVSNGVVETVQADSGEYSIELQPDTYIAIVSADGYQEEEFRIVLQDTDSMVQDFNISPALAAGQIRIVLEWGSSPADLDSHLEGTSSSGVSVNVSFTNKTASTSSGVIAELDLDDTSGYGPETITLNDVAGNYEYYVFNYSGTGKISESGATVKIYTDDSSRPMILTPPSNHDDLTWHVLKINNGRISIDDAIES